MSYFSDRLYWLSDEGLVTLLTTRSLQYSVTKLPSSGDVTSFTMVHTPPALRFLKSTFLFHAGCVPSANRVAVARTHVLSVNADANLSENAGYDVNMPQPLRKGSCLLASVVTRQFSVHLHICNLGAPAKVILVVTYFFASSPEVAFIENSLFTH